MNVKTWLGLLGFLIAFAMSAAQVGCNAQSAAFDLFSRQGLNLLRPARDYIQPGGMVFVPKKGNPVYEEPKDDVAPEKGNLIDFRANILEETANKKAGLSAALTLAATIIPMPISAGAQSNKHVTLKQIDTTGVRLSTNALDGLIAAPNTSKAAAAAIPRGTRVFVVQEVYKTTSLDLHAEDGKAFNLNFNDGKAVADCKLAGSGDKKPDNSKNDTKKPAPGNDTKDSATSGANKADSKGTNTKSKGQSSTPLSASAASKLGAGIAVCVADDYTLKLRTKEPITFAVRLAELELSDQKTVQRNRGSVLKQTLGGEGEISASLINDKEPAIDHMRFRGKPKM